jgi:hypothetical protein
MNNEMNIHSEFAECLCKFDRKLNPKESLKDQVIWRHLNQQAQRTLYLTGLDCQIDQYFSGVDMEHD